nr:hypothetical protein Clen_446 [Cedratvirus lena]
MSLQAEKQCFACKEYKNSSLFYKDKKSKDGLNCRCKSCESEHRKVLRKKRKTNSQSLILSKRASLSLCSFFEIYHCSEQKEDLGEASLNNLLYELCQTEGKHVPSVTYEETLSSEEPPVVKRKRKRKKRVHEFFLEYPSPEETRIVEKKFCSECEKWKSLGNFYKDRRSWDTLSSWCKECRIVYQNKRTGTT